MNVYSREFLDRAVSAKVAAKDELARLVQTMALADC